MKDNHIPAKDRIRQRIIKMEIKEDSAWVKIGGGNPYLKCKYCQVTNVQESLTGHYHGCPLKGIDKQIAYFKKLLEQ